MEQLSEAIERSGRSKEQIAAAAGVSRSTLYRILNREVAPSVSTLREIAIATGNDLAITLAPLGDPDAAVAARLLLEAGYPGRRTPGVDEWVARVERQSGDPAFQTKFAGCSSSVFHQPTRALLRGRRLDALRLSSAGDFAGGRWAVSGGFGLEALGSNDVAGIPLILWTTDADRAARSLVEDGVHVVSSPESADVIIVQAGDEAVFYDSWQFGQITVPSPMQIVLDAFGIGAESQAAAIIKGW